MKIAHVITRMIVGGAQENTLDSVCGLQAMGHQVTLITGAQIGAEGGLLDMHAGPTPRVVTLASLCREISPMKDMRAFLALYRLFRREDFDVVHTHSSKAGILGRYAAWLAGTKKIVHTVHGFAIGPYQHGLANRFFSMLERGAARKTDTLVFVAQGLEREARRIGLRPKGRTRVLVSGFDWRSFEAAGAKREETRSSLGVLPEDILLVKVARFFPLKGHGIFFEALAPLMRDNPRLKVLFLGDGILRGQFEEKARAWNGRMRFAGLVHRREVGRYLAAADILVHASLREGLARVIPQAFALKKPVVAFDVDAARDLMEDGKTGVLVGEQTPQALGLAIARLVDDAASREALGAEGHRRARPLYGLDAMIRGLADIYET